MTRKELAGSLFATGCVFLAVGGILWLSLAARNYANGRIAEATADEMADQVILLCATKGAVEFPKKQTTIKCEVAK